MHPIANNSSMVESVLDIVTYPAIPFIEEREFGIRVPDPETGSVESRLHGYCFFP